MTNKLVTDLEKIASQSAKKKGFEVIYFNFDMELNPVSIQVQIRHEENNKDISLSDCAQLTFPMNEAIENSNLLKEKFILEISSAGIGEFLTEERDFQTFKGFPVEVSYKDRGHIEKLKKGLLQERSENDLLINLKGRISRIPRDDVITVRLTTSTG